MWKPVLKTCLWLCDVLAFESVSIGLRNCDNYPFPDKIKKKTIALYYFGLIDVLILWRILFQKCYLDFCQILSRVVFCCGLFVCLPLRNHKEIGLYFHLFWNIFPLPDSRKDPINTEVNYRPHVNIPTELHLQVPSPQVKR